MLPAVPIIPQCSRCPGYPAVLPVSRCVVQLSRCPGYPAVVPPYPAVPPAAGPAPLPAIPQLPAIQPPPALLFLATRTPCSRCVLPPLLLLGVFFSSFLPLNGDVQQEQGAEQTEGAEHSGAMRTGDAALS